MGRQQFSEIVGVDRTVRVEFINADQTGNVGSGAVEHTVTKPSAGFIFDLLHMEMDVPGIAGESGNLHQLRLRSESADIPLLNGKSAGDQRVRYKRGTWESATDTKLPTAEAAQVLQGRTARADENNGFRVSYNNDTASAQTGDRRIRYWVRKVRVS